MITCIPTSNQVGKRAAKMSLLGQKLLLMAIITDCFAVMQENTSPAEY